MELYLRTEMERNAKYINFNIPIIRHLYPLITAVVFYWSTIVFSESTYLVVIVLGVFLKMFFNIMCLEEKWMPLIHAVVIGMLLFAQLYQFLEPFEIFSSSCKYFYIL